MTTTQSLAEIYRQRMQQIVVENVRSKDMQLYFEVPLTVKRAQLHATQMAYMTRERRRGWGYLLARVPHVDIRRVIIQHEVEEVLVDPRTGHDHLELAIQLGIELGLTREEMTNIRPLPTTRAALAGMINQTIQSPWLQAFGGYAVAEWPNMDELFEEGGLAGRRVKKWEAELGMVRRRNKANDVHSTADDDHSNATWTMIEKYAVTVEDWEGLLEATQECMDYWRVFWRGMADAMLELD